MMTPKGKWSIAGFTLMALMIVLTMLLAILPAMIQSNDINGRSQQIEASNVDRQRFLEHLKTTALDKEKYFIEVTQQRTLMPTVLGIVEYMATLSDYAAATGVTIANLSVQPPSHFVAPASVLKTANIAAAQARLANGSLFVSELSVSVTGPVARVSNFLDVIRKGKRYALVYKVGAPEGEGAKGELTANLSIQLFTLLKK